MSSFPRPTLLKQRSVSQRASPGAVCPMKVMHSIYHVVQVSPAMNLRQALAPLSRVTITTRLLLWFLIISLIPCAVLTAIISISANRSLKKTVRQGLLAIADAKATQLENFIRERRADLNMVSRFTPNCRFSTSAGRSTAERGCSIHLPMSS